MEFILFFQPVYNQGENLSPSLVISILQNQRQHKDLLTSPGPVWRREGRMVDTMSPARGKFPPDTSGVQVKYRGRRP